MQTLSVTERYNKLFSELEDCDEDEQKEKIEKMNEVMDEMHEEELESVVTAEVFNGIYTMIEEKKLTLENSFLLLKHVGSSNALKSMSVYGFGNSSLGERFEEMIVEEEKKKEKRNEKLLIDLCECYLMLKDKFLFNLLSICVSCLLEVGLNKGEKEGDGNEVETSLLTLSSVGMLTKIPEELYLSEIKGIIQHHQDHHNLTPLAYQSAWQFLVNRLFLNGVLEKVMTDELHFVKKAKREMEEQSKCVDWKRKEEERGGKGVKEGIVLRRWLFTLFDFFFSCHLWDDEYSELVCCIVRVFLSAKDNHRKYSMRCIDLLKAASEKRAVKIGGLLKGGADDAVLEGIQQPTMDYEMAYDCLRFFMNVCDRLKSKDDEAGEAKGKGLKRKVVEKMEEEGYEDAITSFHEMIPFLNDEFCCELSLSIDDYFVNI
ncbi:uncharacterized protein MONOS_14984 [Monocercomonoides exilis]|uniref:uncharacterized protein n=1 Tax=Monocercomonoides exilis TaxID=2049356 RepID=UPI00355ABAF9|nr:hypothetical protein MONOS_14984 [Monocercomonoides exilis]|eukprot:MONOS_14984.1-p1 / transcript=MONOS_14984.1 / gene=MONOS_14984 / organism=Monocercomonoides_exilis_PA203 / gene_product=unspecified product / transcript_product=unspecified product / location=Mono_scaffold01120:1392-2809(-) / protein_length=430 / sequence_SO=supercontig / SO=protein_coding / is_pseudo=false